MASAIDTYMSIAVTENAIQCFPSTLIVSCAVLMNHEHKQWDTIKDLNN